MFPIKYIDNNLVWNKDNEVFAYYELIPYNYSFLSAEQKFIVHDSFRQLIAQSREGKIHALQIATESSIRSIQEQSKRLVTGRLKDVAYQKIDEQTEALVSMIGDNQVDYRFFIGFKLIVTGEKVSLESVKKSAFMTFKEFLNEVNHTLMNDFISMPDDEINRYMKMEKLLENKISRRFKFRRLDNHAYQSGSETSSNVVDALDSVDELKRRCDEVKDFYDDLNVKLVRPAGDMLGLHCCKYRIKQNTSPFIKLFIGCFNPNSSMISRSGDTYFSVSVGKC